ncbi:MAG: XkdF-like putative serine protease domain-containing protein [Caldisericales bacterium]|jgi:phage head maturation protease|nr:HK97 family phage prohead protease [Caldisericia bacterium]MCE5177081.1 XkdF-like putative serine protease domain-containing protein [bacterium]NMD15102.1 hypothetical protein [Caldisericales bacterium]
MAGKSGDALGIVWGWASTEALDSQGDIISTGAVKEALGAYSRWRNVREMHEPRAVGVASHLSLTPKGLLVGADIYDKKCWDKIKRGIYKGFSVGGVVTSKRPKNFEGKTIDVITGMTIAEISVVDQPANPEAGFILVCERKE